MKEYLPIPSIALSGILQSRIIISVFVGECILCVYHEVQPLKLRFHLLNTHIYLVFYSRSRETLAYGATMESNVTNSKVEFFYLQFSTMM